MRRFAETLSLAACPWAGFELLRRWAGFDTQPQVAPRALNTPAALAGWSPSKISTVCSQIATGTVTSTQVTATTTVYTSTSVTVAITTSVAPTPVVTSTVVEMYTSTTIVNSISTATVPPSMPPCSSFTCPNNDADVCQSSTGILYQFFFEQTFTGSPLRTFCSPTIEDCFAQCLARTLAPLPVPDSIVLCPVLDFVIAGIIALVRVLITVFKKQVLVQPGYLHGLDNDEGSNSRSLDWSRMAVSADGVDRV
jgi:hypothetical protein